MGRRARAPGVLARLGRVRARAPCPLRWMERARCARRLRLPRRARSLRAPGSESDVALSLRARGARAPGAAMGPPADGFRSRARAMGRSGSRRRSPAHRPSSSIAHAARVSRRAPLARSLMCRTSRSRECRERRRCVACAKRRDCRGVERAGKTSSTATAARRTVERGRNRRAARAECRALRIGRNGRGRRRIGAAESSRRTWRSEARRRVGIERARRLEALERAPVSATLSATEA